MVHPDGDPKGLGGDKTSRLSIWEHVELGESNPLWIVLACLVSSASVPVVGTFKSFPDDPVLADPGRTWESVTAV